MARREGRWTIDSLAASEVEALARAEELYADESCEGVRVLRGHFSASGQSFETQIMERMREGRRGAAPIRLAAAPDEEAWCETLADFYGAASRRAIARLLRNFLDRFQITPTELLYNARFIKQLDNQDTLLPGAVGRMAAIQAEARGADRRVRADVIDRLVAEATAKARDAAASRAAPKLGPEGLAALAETVAERAKDAAEQAFWLRYALSRAFEDANSLARKFEIAMGWAAAGIPPALMALIDEITAGVMGAASMIKDTLGNQPHLGAALLALADLAAGRHGPSLAGAPACFPTLAKLMAEAPMPETRLVLYDRLQREIASDKALSRDDAGAQLRLFEALIDKLVDGAGIFAGGPAMVEALARRSRRFDIVGGVEDLRFAAPDPAERFARILELEKTMPGRRAQQALATYLRDAIDRYAGEAAGLAALAAGIAATALPEATKQALIGRLPAPAKAL